MVTTTTTTHTRVCFSSVCVVCPPAGPSAGCWFPSAAPWWRQAPPAVCPGPPSWWRSVPRLSPRPPPSAAPPPAAGTSEWRTERQTERRLRGNAVLFFSHFFSHTGSSTHCTFNLLVCGSTFGHCGQFTNNSLYHLTCQYSLIFMWYFTRVCKYVSPRTSSLKNTENLLPIRIMDYLSDT